MFGPARALGHGAGTGVPDAGGGDFAIGQVFRQARGRLGRGIIALGLIGVNLVRHERAKATDRGLFTDTGVGQDHIAPAHHRIAHAPIVQIIGGGPIGGRVEILGRGDQIGHRTIFNCAPEGAVNLIEIAARLGLDRPGFEQDVTGVTLGRNAVVFERGFYALVPLAAFGIIEARPMHRARARLGNHVAQHVQRPPTTQDQPRALVRQLLGQRGHRQAQAPFRRGAYVLGHLVQNEQRDHRRTGIHRRQ